MRYANKMAKQSEDGLSQPINMGAILAGCYLQEVFKEETKGARMKPRRLRDKGLLERVRKMPCVVCGVEKDVQPCHIQTVGSGGPDTDWNVIPQCVGHHIQQGSMPWRDWMRKQPRIEKLLTELGWYWDGFRLWNDKLSKGA